MKTKFNAKLFPELKIIKDEVELYTKIEDIGSKCRTYDYSMARWLYIKLAKEFTNYSTTAIASAIHRDHSTVVHALNKIEFELSVNKSLQNQYDELSIILMNKTNQDSVDKIEKRIAELESYIEKLAKRKNKLIKYAITYPEFEDQKNEQIFWS